MDAQEEIEVPSFFLCPISLEIMRDPVTISTGLTYDRESIEKWLFSNNSNNNTCPLTKIPLTNEQNTEITLTPNHTLRRLIQSWCTLNVSYGVERFPTPKPPITKTQILKLCDASRKSRKCLVSCLEKLRCISSESSASKRCLENTSQVIEFLVSLIILEENSESNNISNQALSILAHLHITGDTIRESLLLGEKQGAIFESLVKIMQRRNTDESRTYAIGFMKLLVEQVTGFSFRVEHFIEIVQLLKDNVSAKASKAALKILTLASQWGRNRVRAVESGAVHVLVNMLLESKEKILSEMVLCVLDTLCACAEGRAELLSHGAGLAVVSKKILRVSHYASEKGIRVLYAIARFSGSLSVVKEMMELGVVSKLCLILQVDCDPKIKEKARDVLRLHGKIWMNLPCAPTPTHVLRSLSY